MEWILILKSFLLGWFLAFFEPLQDSLNKWVKPHIPKWLSYITKSLSCITCLSFWSGIIVFQDFFIGSGAALLAFTYQKIIDSIKINL